MTIEIRRLESAAALRSLAEPFLMRNEAHHNLILGLIDQLERSSDFYESRPYFAAAVKDGEPVAAAVMTPPFPFVLSLCDDAGALPLLARDVHEVLPATSGVNAPSPGARAFAEVWSALTGESFALGLAERCYKLTTVRHPMGVSGGPRLANLSDLDLLTSWNIAFAREAVPWEENSPKTVREGLRKRLTFPRQVGGTVIWEVKGRPVSMASYGSPTPNSMRIGPVYTPPEHRRRGYAGACTAAAARAILDAGKAFATLFTDLANPTTNNIYQEIGFEPVCDAEMWRFGGR